MFEKGQGNLKECQELQENKNEALNSGTVLLSLNPRHLTTLRSKKGGFQLEFCNFHILTSMIVLFPPFIHIKHKGAKFYTTNKHSPSQFRCFRQPTRSSHKVFCIIH